MHPKPHRFPNVSRASNPLPTKKEGAIHHDGLPDTAALVMCLLFDFLLQLYSNLKTLIPKFSEILDREFPLDLIFPPEFPFNDVHAHYYCTRYSCRNVTPRHTSSVRARVR